MTLLIKSVLKGERNVLIGTYWITIYQNVPWKRRMSNFRNLSNRKCLIIMKN